MRTFPRFCDNLLCLLLSCQQLLNAVLSDADLCHACQLAAQPSCLCAILTIGVNLGLDVMAYVASKLNL